MLQQLIIGRHVISSDFIAPPCDQLLEILYQDDDILIINKPSGLLSLSGKHPLNWDSVHYRLVHGQLNVSAPFPQAKLPHRLDFGTSGLMLVALNKASAKHLNQQFQAGLIKKNYIAMLSGSLAQDEGVIRAAIAKDSLHFPRVKICHATGKPAISYYQVLKRLDEPSRCLVKFTPITGRTHQLRVHSQALGHPIAGCDLYYNEQSRHLSERLCLHASDICFMHPDGREINWHSPCPFLM